MKPRVRREPIRTIALLLGASSVPAVAWGHWEGVEAADPSTPAAVLRLESATAAYTEANAAPVSWRTLFEDAGDSGEAAEAPRASEPDPGVQSSGRGDAVRTPVTAAQ